MKIKQLKIITLLSSVLMFVMLLAVSSTSVSANETGSGEFRHNGVKQYDLVTDNNYILYSASNERVNMEYYTPDGDEIIDNYDEVEFVLRGTLIGQLKVEALGINITFNHSHVYKIRSAHVYFVIEENGKEIKSFSNDTEVVINFFNADIMDNQRPAISGEENFVTNVDDAKPVTYFQSFLTAVDETDGVVPVYVITDNYTANKSVLGTHKVVFGAKDNSGNQATLEAFIRVVDITKPIINGNASVVKIGYKEVWNIDTFKSTLTVSDNYSTLTNADITVKSDGYTSNKTKLGTYNVVFAAKDSSNNEATLTKPVQVYDNIKPTFSGPTKLSTSNTTILTESDVRAQLTANDEVDGNVSSKIKLVEDNFTGKGNKVGSYTIKYSVADNAGNTTEHVVTIERLDSIPPIIWIEDGVSIKTTPTTPLTFEQIISILQATGQVSSNTQTHFSLKYDEYTGNESTPGIYAMSINARSVDGNESLHNMSIIVLDDSNDDGITTNPGFEIGTWIKENPALVTVGIVAVIGIGYFVFRKKK